MKKIVSLIWIFMLFACCVFMVSCEKTSNTNNNISNQDDLVEVGFSFDTFVMERWERDRDIFVSRMNELGAEVNVQCANGDIEEQKKQIEYFIDKGVDVIVVVPVDVNLLKDQVKEAQDKGIKVVAYDRLIMNSNVDFYITFDNEKVGILMGKSICNRLSKGSKVLVLNGPTTDSNVSYVYAGFKEVADTYGWNIVDVQYIEGWNQDLAYDYINKNIETVKDVDAIVCGNDALAGRTIEALSEYGLTDSILVLGQDADLESCQRIVEGTQYMTVFKPIDELAKTAAEYVYKLVEDGDLDCQDTISDGENLISYVVLEPYAVTKNNIDALVIDSGFHQREEVYLNIEK